ncbi:Hypothetical_protein [Hexamita inflata]|uniref:Hypothetical_protein n=1 Tax=Hexamita inflata TaxID=28002 RepID=A0AA86TU84_9EUKA|nr:Hypothetical protein HINF_LOCUS14867 [Hexamita inflata]
METPLFQNFFKMLVANCINGVFNNKILLDEYLTRLTKANICVVMQVLSYIGSKSRQYKYNTISTCSYCSPTFRFQRIYMYTNHEPHHISVSQSECFYELILEIVEFHNIEIRLLTQPVAIFWSQSIVKYDAVSSLEITKNQLYDTNQLYD